MLGLIRNMKVGWFKSSEIHILYLPSSRRVEILVSRWRNTVFGTMSTKLWLRSRTLSRCSANGANKSAGSPVSQFPRSRRETSEMRFANTSGISRDNWLFERSRSCEIISLRTYCILPVATWFNLMGDGKEIKHGKNVSSYKVGLRRAKRQNSNYNL